MSKLRSSMLIAGGSQYLIYLLSFIKIAVVSRLLGPAEIGAFTLAASLIFLAQFLRVFGTWDYIVSQKEMTETKLRQCFTIICVMAVLITSGYMLAAAPLAEFFKAPELLMLIWVMTPSFLVLPIGTVALALMNREMDFQTLSKIRIVATVVDTLIVIGMAVYGFGVVSLAWGYTFSNVASTLLVMVYAQTKLIYRPTFAGLGSILRFGAVSSAGTFLSNVGTSGPPLVLGYGMTPAAVGVFGRGQTLITFFRQGVEFATRPVTMAWFANKSSDDPKLVGESYLKVTTLMSGFAWPVYVFLYFAAPTLIPFLLGDQWQDSIAVTQILCLGGILSFYAVTGISVLEGQGLVAKKLRFNFLAQGCRFALLFASLQYGILAFSAALSFSHVISFILITLFLKVQTDLSLRDVIASMKLSALVAGVLVAVTWGLFQTVLPDGQLNPWQFMLLLVVMTGTALGTLIVSAHPLWDELKNLAGKIRLKRAT
jgi:O-antigen/teichoic acid export membrane protein